MKTLHMVAFLLVVVGAINWGLVALFDLDLVVALFDNMPQVRDGLYVLIGLSGLYILITHKGDCKICSKKK